MLSIINKDNSFSCKENSKRTKLQLGEDTLNKLYELADKGEELNKKHLNYIEIKDSELEDLILPKEYLDYPISQEDLIKYIDPFILINLNILCETHLKKDELIRWVLLGYNTTIATRIVDLSVIEQEYKEFHIPYPINIYINGLKKHGYNPKLDWHRSLVKECALLRSDDDVSMISPEELRKRMDPYTAETLKVAFNCPYKEEEAFRWVLRGMPLLAAIDTVLSYN